MILSCTSSSKKSGRKNCSKWAKMDLRNSGNRKKQAGSDAPASLLQPRQFRLEYVLQFRDAHVFEVRILIRGRLTVPPIETYQQRRRRQTAGQFQFEAARLARA